MTTIDEATLARLVELDAAATPGPWQEFAESGDYWLAQAADGGEPGDVVIADTGPDVFERQEDVDLIAALRNAAPDLLVAARALGQVRAELEAGLLDNPLAAIGRALTLLTAAELEAIDA